MELQVGEEIQFTTVPSHFYNGHKLSIVELKIDVNTLLSFEDGEENLIDWDCSSCNSRNHYLWSFN